MLTVWNDYKKVRVFTYTITIKYLSTQILLDKFKKIKKMLFMIEH